VPDLRELLARTGTIAVVGLSRDPRKDAHAIPARMRAYGWRVIGVNPEAPELLGEPAYPSLADVPDPVDLVNVFRPAEFCADVAREAVAAGARALWLQLGIRSLEARAVADAGGLEYVEDRCIAVEAARLGVRGPRPG
jgi:hypothetical protein